ncbi:hypothetical protein M5689_014476 [Euphorbia peplus]|nr:hypothetical protein M5689_014476 [Euphorbia peplus]
MSRNSVWVVLVLLLLCHENYSESRQLPSSDQVPDNTTQCQYPYCQPQPLAPPPPSPNSGYPIYGGAPPPPVPEYYPNNPPPFNQANCTQFPAQCCLYAPPPPYPYVYQPYPYHNNSATSLSPFHYFMSLLFLVFSFYILL